MNSSEKKPERPALFDNILERRARIHPDRKLCAFEDFLDGPSTATYDQFRRNLLFAATQLRERADPGDRVSNLCPPVKITSSGFRCLLVSVIAVPCFPPGNAKCASILAGGGERLPLVRQYLEVSLTIPRIFAAQNVAAFSEYVGGYSTLKAPLSGERLEDRSYGDGVI